MKLGKITKILKRHSTGAFDVEDENGNCWFIQMAFKLEETWQAEQREKRELVQLEAAYQGEELADLMDPFRS